MEVKTEGLFVQIDETISMALGIVKARTRMSKREIVEEALKDYLAKHHEISLEQPKTW